MNIDHATPHDKNVIFVSAQSGYDPKTKRVLSNIESQTRQSLENIVSAIAPAGLNRDDIATCRIYLLHEADIDVVREVYELFFAGTKLPPKSIVGVSFLPKINDYDILVSIEAVVVQN